MNPDQSWFIALDYGANPYFILVLMLMNANNQWRSNRFRCQMKVSDRKCAMNESANQPNIKCPQHRELLNPAFQALQNVIAAYKSGLAEIIGIGKRKNKDGSIGNNANETNAANKTDFAGSASAGSASAVQATGSARDVNTKTNTYDVDELLAQISSLNSQLEEQHSTIKELSSEIDSQHITIGQMLFDIEFDIYKLYAKEGTDGIASLIEKSMREAVALEADNMDLCTKNLELALENAEINSRCEYLGEIIRHKTKPADVS
jgi:hypothetical protein